MLNVDGRTDGRTNGRTYERTNGRKLARLCLPAKAGATKTCFTVREYRGYTGDNNFSNCSVVSPPVFN